MTGVARLLKACPDDLSNQLLQVGEDIGTNRWKIGDLCHVIMLLRDRLNIQGGEYVSAQDVYIAVSIMAKREVSARTVAYYYLNSRFFVQEIREVYDVLPFHHFDIARQYGDWRKALELSMGFLADNGYRMSGEQLKQALGIDSFIEQEQQEQVQQSQNSAIENTMILAVRFSLSQFLKRLQDNDNPIVRRVYDLAVEFDQELERLVLQDIL